MMMMTRRGRKKGVSPPTKTHVTRSHLTKFVLSLPLDFLSPLFCPINKTQKYFFYFAFPETDSQTIDTSDPSLDPLSPFLFGHDVVANHTDSTSP